jgi:hypothetical protein
MPGVRGVAWGNALGGYRFQKRVGGRFIAGKLPGARPIGKKPKPGRTKYNTAIKVAGGAAVVAAAAGGGYYAYRKGLFKGPSSGQPKIVASFSGPSGKDSLGRNIGYGLGPVSALKEGGRNIIKAGTSGSVVEKMVDASNAVRGNVVGAGRNIKAIADSEGMDKVLHVSKGVAGIAGATAATAVASNITVGVVKNMVETPHVPGTPRKAGRPKGSKNKVKEGASVAAEITKGVAHTTKPPIVPMKGRTLAQSDANVHKAQSLTQPVLPGIKLKSKAARKSTLLTARPQAAQEGVKITEHVATTHTTKPPTGKTTSATHKPTTSKHDNVTARIIADTPEAAIARRKARLAQGGHN